MILMVRGKTKQELVFRASRARFFMTYAGCDARAIKAEREWAKNGRDNEPEACCKI